MNYEALFVNPNGHTPRTLFIPAMLTVLAVMAFYAFIVTGRTAQFCMLVLLYPAFVLLARRLHDMGQSASLALIPLLLMLLMFATQLHYFSLGNTIDTVLLWLALAVTALFILWASLAQTRIQPPEQAPKPD